MMDDITYCNAKPYDECATCIRRWKSELIIRAVISRLPIRIMYPPALVNGKCPLKKEES